MGPDNRLRSFPDERVTAHALVVFARHGETTLNAEKRFRGRADPPLTQHGERQAQALATLAATYGPSHLYASPRSRARSTAQAIAEKTGLDPLVTSSLDDLDYGHWTGKTEGEARTEWPHLFEQWRRDPEAVEFPQGEPVKEAVWRTSTFLKLAMDSRRDEPSVTLVAVTHDAIIRCAVCLALGISLASYHRIVIGLASTTGVRVDDQGFHLEWVNETAHVRAELGNAKSSR
jgi:broad specificity phosphatase PhoE